jgi:hypothetical protein
MSRKARAPEAAGGSQRQFTARDYFTSDDGVQYERGRCYTATSPELDSLYDRWVTEGKMVPGGLARS